MVQIDSINKKRVHMRAKFARSPASDGLDVQRYLAYVYLWPAEQNSSRGAYIQARA